MKTVRTEFLLDFNIGSIWTDAIFPKVKLHFTDILGLKKVSALDRFSVNSGFGLDRVSAYSGFGLHRVSVYSGSV